MKTEIADLLRRLVEKPNEFRLDKDPIVLIHTPTLTEFWTSPGCERLYQPVKADFRFLDRRRFRRILKRWLEWERRRRLNEMFNPNELVGGEQPHQYGYLESR